MLSRQPSDILIVTPVISAAAYADGDQVGPKATEIPNAFLQVGGIGFLKSLLLVDKGDQKVDLDVLLWARDPSSGITSSDNDAFAVSDAEVAASLLGKVSIVAADYLDIGGNAVAILDNLSVALKASLDRKDLNPGKSLYLTLVSGGAPTYASTSDLVLKLGLIHS